MSKDWIDELAGKLNAQKENDKRNAEAMLARQAVSRPAFSALRKAIVEAVQRINQASKPERLVASGDESSNTLVIRAALANDKNIGIEVLFNGASGQVTTRAAIRGFSPGGAKEQAPFSATYALETTSAESQWKAGNETLSQDEVVKRIITPVVEAVLQRKK